MRKQLHLKFSWLKAIKDGSKTELELQTELDHLEKTIRTALSK